MCFPICDPFSIIQFLLADAQPCQWFENDLMTTCKRSNERSFDLIAMILSAEHFKRYQLKGK